jgi:hypothetical protein
MQGKPIHCLFSLFSISSTCTLHKVWQYPDLARSAFSTCLTGSSHFFTSHQYPLSSRLFQCYSDAVQTQIPSFREDYPQLRSTDFKSEHQVSRTQMIVAFPDSRSTTWIDTRLTYGVLEFWARTYAELSALPPLTENKVAPRTLFRGWWDSHGHIPLLPQYGIPHAVSPTLHWGEGTSMACSPRCHVFSSSHAGSASSAPMESNLTRCCRWHRTDNCVGKLIISSSQTWEGNLEATASAIISQNMKTGWCWVCKQWNLQHSFD